VKPSLLATGLVGLCIVGLWFAGGGTQPLPTANADDAPRVGSPRAHENLTVYFVHGSDAVQGAKLLSLPEALERELAVVHETSDVNLLAVENKSDEYELFIQSGDIVKGGKQDRMVRNDMLLPPKSGVVPLPAHCVEQGRWTNRGTEDARRFKSSTKCAVGNDMKIANFSGQQPAVWQSVGENQTKLNAGLNNRTNVQAAASPTSFQLSLESPELQKKVAEYEAALRAAGEERDDIIGVVFAVNGNVTSADAYGSNAIFRKAWPKLLNSAATEAVAERTDKPTAAAPSARAVEIFLASAAQPEPGPQMTVIDQSGRMTPNGLVSVQYQTPGTSNEPDRVGRVIIEGNEVTRDRVIPNQVDLRSFHANPAPNPPAQQVEASGEQIGVNFANAQPPLFNPVERPAPPANPNGNRLVTNANVNPSSLMVESRDPTRQNAVIHRTYIKK
jgi:hypothetical protein